jgi:ribonuclease P protein component
VAALGRGTRPFSFPKRLRLTSKKEITLVFRRGRYHKLGWMQAKSLPNRQRESRFLVSVKKSLGPAPHRNRIKRLVREAIRLNRHRLRSTHDLCVFVTIRPEQPLDLSAVEKEINSLFERLSGERVDLDPAG